MRLSIKSEYACLALIDLAKSYNKVWISSRELSSNYEIPLKFLEQILLLLKQGGFVRSRRGPDGGYMLTRDPGKINLAEVLRFINGPIASTNSVSKFFYESTPLERNKKLKSVFQDIRDYASKKLENAALTDLI